MPHTKVIDLDERDPDVLIETGENGWTTLRNTRGGNWSYSPAMLQGSGVRLLAALLPFAIAAETPEQTLERLIDRLAQLESL